MSQTGLHLSPGPPRRIAGLLATTFGALGHSYFGFVWHFGIRASDFATKQPAAADRWGIKMRLPWGFLDPRCVFHRKNPSPDTSAENRLTRLATVGWSRWDRGRRRHQDDAASAFCTRLRRSCIFSRTSWANRELGNSAMIASPASIASCHRLSVTQIAN